MAEDLVKALSDLEEKKVLQIVKERLDAGEDPGRILADCRKAMEIVGKKFADGDYFIPDLVYSGEMLTQINEMVKPKLKGPSEVERLGKIVLGTVAGDIHDIGLNIVDFMLDMNGFEVYNLGIDQPSKHFVDKVKETGATIVGLSGFLTLAFDSMKETVEAIKAAGLRDTVRIMIGGGQIDEQVRQYAGADAYGQDAMAAVTLARKWVGAK